jgi:hypothetical protein
MEAGRHTPATPHLRPVSPQVRAAIVWFVVFVALQTLALAVTLSLSPAGFDPCGEGGHGPMGLQRAIAAGATLASAAHACWRLRSWAILPAACCLTLSAGAWWILLRDPASFSC